MTIVRWSPLAELDSVERRMRRALDELGLVPSVLPAADVYETEGEFVYELEVPGFDRDELTVEVRDHVLAVKGERTETKEEERKDFRLHERLAKKFERTFELPREAAAEQLAARFERGVLAVHVPKSAASTPQKVEIEAES